MKDSLPNMDEVVASLKQFASTFDDDVIPRQIRLLIEEREQLKMDIMHWESIADQWKVRAVEQDKEIQALKDQNTVLDDKLTELESSFETCTRCSLTIVHK